VSLATLDELEDVCGPQADPVAAQQALDEATTKLQMATGQQLVQVVDDKVTLDPEGADTLLLPELPVSALGPLVVEGVTLLEDEYEWSSTGILRLTSYCGCGPHFPKRLASVDVTYTHGYDPVPRDLALACATMACRALSGGGPTVDGVPVTAERIGSWSVSYATGLTDAEQAVINRYWVYQ
jgi:hypothetical protein